MQLGNRKNQHSFAQIPDVNMARSTFDRSFAIKDTFDFDYLIPIFVDEVIPGDTHNLTMNAFARLATQVVPIMDNMYMDYFFFFVPNRLIYDKWEKLNGAQDNPGDTTDYIMPILTPGVAFTVGSIFDKYGLPTGVANVAIKNTLPLRAYIKIYNDWFRDENLQNSVTLPVGQGPDTQGMFALQKRGKRKDYFTGALPWPQKGTAVALPLGTTAPVNLSDTTGTPVILKQASSHAAFGAAAMNTNGSGNILGGAGQNTSVVDPNGTLYADLSTASAATINQLRQAFQMQSLFELDARGGTRYVEILKAHFNVISPDFRLQRAEYLGGGTVTINSHPVAATVSDGSVPQGNLAAFATSIATDKNNIGFTKSFVEHGYVIGLACARADLTYQQGINRMFLKSTRYDFFWPKLQELGEQAILKGEIYAQGTAADAEAWAYQERYSEYRYRPSEIHGQFRSTYATPLDMWHLAEEFGSLPTLSSTFIVQNTPIERAIAVDSEPDLLFDCWFKLTSARPMMTYSAPLSLGRF